MEDHEIVELYWERSEEAIAQTQKKYGRYCHYIACNILRSEEDAEECVNDMYERAWHAIPPGRPERLSVFLGKITRNLSLDRYEKNHAAKRGTGQAALVLDELLECIPGTDTMSDIADALTLRTALNEFLWSLPEETRKIFLRRYWYVSSVKEIANEYGISQSKVKMSLMRTRNKLKEYLEREGIDI